MQYVDELVSVVIPVYNAEKYIEDTLHCILNQTYKKIEVVIVDDVSTDNTLTKIKAFHDERIKLYQNDKNSGPAVTRNKGIEAATGRYLAYMDADDLCDLDKIEKQMHFIKEKDCAFCFTGYEFADENGVRNGKVVHIPERVDYEYALRHTIISTITVMFDRNKLSNEILSMPTNARGEDTATWWKILRHGYIAYGIDEPLSVYRRHGGSRSSNKFSAVYGTWRMYRDIEKLGLVKSLVCFTSYVWNAVKRRL